ncbi:hypothetical protein FHS95_002289 [Sphingomonas naasensis]|uniref:PilZ domain-containing protein n=1 Tax=Sphingomonas naasensis TaxID=1344951 RepID=A0A4S1WTD0_9SPHN|nr:PilZ domain-containing protein [Sphingomonas naasensis]NIJ20597.1 hypothetical protein [Sphingomonas naasensis]TGX44676.1 PilZ domain-containing protein [Sphingomonas naasensis]
MSEALHQRERMPRKNLMLAATIESAGSRAPVRIRNLSETGAMLDGAALPGAGAALVLLRADIQVAAKVVWREAGRCGICFDNVAASVDEWVTGKRAATFNGQQGQARVDAIQSAVRSGAMLPSEPAPGAGGALRPGELEQRISEEIVYVQRLIDALGEELVEDPVMLQRHSRVLQNLDRASQVLAHLGSVLAAPDRAGAAQAIAMQDLRERLLRKPIF